MKRAGTRLVCVLVCIYAALLIPRATAQQGTPKSRTLAVIIAAQNYRNGNIAKLTYVLNDAKTLKSVLRERAGVSDAELLLMTDDSPPRLQPTAANLKARVAEFLSQARADDRLLIFFSGHGDIIEDETFLAPLDYDGRDASTGWKVAEVKALLTACPAGIKFLVLDCCHAGGKDANSKASGTQEKLLSNLKPKADDDYLLLASCRGDQKSYEWQAREQSFFTFWLCRALEGGADRNGDGKITFEETYDYVSRRTQNAVEKVYRRTVDQEPVRGISTRVGGDPVVLSLRPEERDSLCRRIAYHLDLDIRANGLKRVAVREFSDLRSRQEPLAGANATVNFAQAIRHQLEVLSRGMPPYTVDPELAKGFGTQTREDVRSFQEQAGRLNIDALVDGSLRIMEPNHILGVECRLTGKAGDELVRPSGLLRMSIDTYADAGVSYTLVSQRHTLQPDERLAAGPRFDPVTLDAIEEQNRSNRHPLDPSANPPFPVKLQVWSETDQKYKIPRFEGASMIVGARKNEEFAIHITNNTADVVGVRLFVDGINTKGMQREEMDRARFWLVKPNVQTAFRGWEPLDSEGKFIQKKGNVRFDPVSEPTAGGQKTIDLKLRKFIFSDASSVAARLGFYDHVGSITAVFYSRAGKALGVLDGAEFIERVEVLDFTLGPCLGAVTVKYVEESELQANLTGDQPRN